MMPPSPIENIKTGKPEEKSFTFQPRILLNIHHFVKFQSHVGYFCKRSQYVFTKQSNVHICSSSSLWSAEQMETIGAHASGGCSPPSATVLSAPPLTSSLGLDSGAGCCTVWTLTRGAEKHVTLSWLDTSKKHWCWRNLCFSMNFDFLFSCIRSSRLAKKKYFHKDITVFRGLQKSFH